MDSRIDTRFEDSDFGDAEWLNPNQNADTGAGSRTGKYVGWSVFLVLLAVLVW
jgi:hypothetical protein